jgi:hypothetical protein
LTAAPGSCIWNAPKQLDPCGLNDTANFWQFFYGPEWIVQFLGCGGCIGCTEYSYGLAGGSFNCSIGVDNILTLNLAPFGDICSHPSTVVIRRLS